MDQNIMQQSLSDLMSVFLKRMNSFEGKLAKNASSSPSLQDLTAEYNIFKSFITKSLWDLQKQIECLASAVDRQEMRARKKVLLVHGLPEAPNEVPSAAVVKVIVEKLKQSTFSASDITICHRLGRARNADKPRPVLCKFKDTCTRDSIWSAKTGLKGSGITISEFLTKSRHDIFLAARQSFGVSKCWTSNGTIFVLGPDGNRHRVDCLEQLSTIQEKAIPRAAAAARERGASRTRKLVAPKYK